MEGLRTSSGSLSKGGTVLLQGGGRHRFVPFLKPLLQQKRCGGTVETTAAIPRQTEAIAGAPAAGMFINPGQRQGQAAGQPLAVAATVLGLVGELLAAVEGKAHHQCLAAPLGRKGGEPGQVVAPAAAPAGRQGGHGQTERITSGHTDAAATHIEGQHGTGTR